MSPRRVKIPKSLNLTRRKLASNAVHFKLFEPKSGKCIKYNTYKIKELSRLLAFIGPRGVNVVTSTSTGQDHVDGLASIMSNVKYSNEDENVAVSSTANVAANSGIETPEEFSHDTTPVPASKPATASKKKNKKKKGKK